MNFPATPNLKEKSTGKQTGKKQKPRNYENKFQIRNQNQIRQSNRASPHNPNRKLLLFNSSSKWPTQPFQTIPNIKTKRKPMPIEKEYQPRLTNHENLLKKPSKDHLSKKTYLTTEMLQIYDQTTNETYPTMN